MVTSPCKVKIWMESLTDSPNVKAFFEGYIAKCISQGSNVVEFIPMLEWTLKCKGGQNA